MKHNDATTANSHTSKHGPLHVQDFQSSIRCIDGDWKTPRKDKHRYEVVRTNPPKRTRRDIGGDEGHGVETRSTVQKHYVPEAKSCQYLRMFVLPKAIAKTDATNLQRAWQQSYEERLQLEGVHQRAKTAQWSQHSTQHPPMTWSKLRQRNSFKLTNRKARENPCLRDQSTSFQPLKTSQSIPVRRLISIGESKESPAPRTQGITNEGIPFRRKPRLKPMTPPPKPLTPRSQFSCDPWITKIKLKLEDVFGTPCKGLTTTTFRILSLIINLLLLSSPCWADLTEEQHANLRRERSEAAKKWAPLIFLHPDERYFPSAIHSFLKNVIPREIPASHRPPDPPVVLPMSRSLDIQALPEGIAGEDTYLIAPIDPKCKNCPLPNFLYGNKPSSDYSAPVYATITSCLPSPQSFRSTRNTKHPPRQPRKLRFRFRKRRGRFLFRGLGKPHPSFIPPNRDPYGSTPPLNSFIPPKRRYDPSSTEVHRKGSSTPFYEDPEANFSTEAIIPPITPPSTTLLPPRSRTLPTSAEMDLDTASSFLSPYPEFSSSESTSFTDRKEREITSADHIVSMPNLTATSDTTPSLEESSANLSVPTPTIQETGTLTTDSSQAPAVGTSGTTPGSKEGRVDLKGHRFTVTYWMFYPFSQGKEVCTSRLWLLGRVFKPRLRNKCYGDLVTLNSHVGDWEHVSIYFEDGLPQRMYVSAHTYGSYYHYDPRDNVFKYRGKDTRLGLPLNPKYPKIIKMDDTHPVLYSALGSHGLWGSPGMHRYESIVPLEDKTGAGTPWRTSENIDIIDYRDPDFDRPDRQWLNFHGYWGNPASGCHRALLGTCDLASGPTGIPLKRENFPCHLPHHPTFFPKD